MFTTETKVKTSKGYPAKIINTDMNYGGRPDVILCFINLPDQVEDTICLFNLNGDPLAHDYGNLIEISEWDNFQLDELVIATIPHNGTIKNINAHFAKAHKSESTGIQSAFIWTLGGTSWSSDSITEVIKCRRPTAEEKNTYKTKEDLVMPFEKIIKLQTSDSVIDIYLGPWNPSINIPFLENGKGTLGDFYKVSIKCNFSFDKQNYLELNPGDIVSYNGKTWGVIYVQN